MTTTIRKPDRNIANTGSLAGSIRDAIEKWMRNEFEGLLPAVVVSYNRDTNKAVIKPLVMMGTTDGAKISRAQVENVEVFRYGGGGFFESFPLNSGDFGWLAACDRDISLVMQASGVEDWPNTRRIHSFSDSIFYPHSVKDWSIADADSSNYVLQSLDGNSVVSLGNDSIELRLGNSKISITETSISLTAGDNIFTVGESGVDHDGTNIGKDHTHTGSSTAPDGPVSDTGAPK